MRLHNYKGDIIENTVELLNKTKELLLDLLFPRRCPFCHEIIPVEKAVICPECRQYVRQHYLIREPVCKKCGKALQREETEYCMDCMTHRRSFDWGISMFQYGRRNLPPVPGKKPGYEKHSMGESILRFKYHNCRDYAEYYIRELLYEHGEELERYQPDVIIPVPVHRSRYRQRGYNQAEILANKLGEMLGAEVSSDLLVRVKKTRPQKELNTAERLKNLQEAFVLAGELPRKYRRIILIDDIYTTGSTMEICSRRLKAAGAWSVCCISICSGQVPDGMR